MNPITEGLAISITGLLTTFLALGLFIVIMIVLQKLFPVRNEEEAGSSTEDEDADVVIAVETESDEEEEVAAVVAAISYFKSRSQSKLGSALETGRGRWWAQSQRK